MTLYKQQEAHGSHSSPQKLFLAIDKLSSKAMVIQAWLKGYGPLFEQT